MSQKKVQLLNPLSGNINVAGVITASSFVGGLTGDVTGNVTGNTSGTAGGLTGTPNITVGSVTAASGAFSGNVSVGGTLTYQDVSHIDAVGIITAQQGIQVLANGLDVTGVSTFKSNVSIADSIIHTGDTDTAIRFPAADTFTIETGGTEAFRVASDQKVYFGDFASAGSKAYIEKEVSGDYKLNIHASSSTSSNRIITINSREDVEALRIDASQRLLVNTTSSTSNIAGYGNGGIQLNSTTTAQANVNIIHRNNSANTHAIVLAKARDGGANGGRVQNNDDFGAVSFQGFDGTGGTTYRQGAEIRGAVDGTPGNTNMPGRLEFLTTPSGSATPAERLRITSTGGVHFSNAELIERVNITGGKLSDNQNINLDNGMIHHFTTTETTTATPNIMTTTGINTAMATGDAMSVTIVTTAAAAGYAATVHIDGVTVGTNGGTLNWTGGSAPSDGGSSGVDIYAYTIMKTASATYTVIATQTKTS